VASQVQIVQYNLGKSFADLKPNELQVWMASSPSQGQNQLAGLVETAIWRDLSFAIEKPGMKLAEVNFQGENWSVLRASGLQEVMFVAVNKNLLLRSVSTIMRTREAVVQNLWPLLIVFALVATLLMSYWALKPVMRLQQSFTKVQLDSPNERISEAHFFREFRDFIRYFNDLIDHLRTSYKQAARFSSDAAHELRTPLTIIRGHLHRLVNESSDGSKLQLELSLVAEEVERLITISNKLLMLSLADAGGIKLDKQAIKLLDLVEEMVEDLKLFFQLLTNLMGNAVKYNHPQGQVKCSAELRNGQVWITVANTTALTLEGLDHRVFERFYRHRQSVNQNLSEKPGDGLGLSLCREIVLAHGGQIEIKTEPEQWVKISSSWEAA
jgi:signal transduction histidine kinase